jgi:glutamate N-acetyltransferase/amino-acid N-acetyltransferase
MEKKSEGTCIEGFEFAAISCGIKKTDALDLALIYSRSPAAIAGVFTTNRFPAAPVVLDRERLKRGRARAVLANAGCANACTGSRGYRDAVQTTARVAEALNIPKEEVFAASTGVIGDLLPMEKIARAVPNLVTGLHAEGLPGVARAIMTTDTVPKWAWRAWSAERSTVRMAGVAKGAGMIHPEMATMLCFVMTDAAVSSGLLQEMLKEGMESSFHAISIDGDMSTNDTVLVLANGASGASPLDAHQEESEVFRDALRGILQELALALVGDAEGATKLVHLVIEGARDRDSAEKAARAIATSPLVKTAFCGEEVNWGRILAAVGYSGIEVDPEQVALWYDDVQVVRAGEGIGKEAEAAALSVARKAEFSVRVSLGLGDGDVVFHTCDLSHEYVNINASYKT